ncbi:MAG: retroviral-like aspartic protease family protein, partial [Candidatus Thiodiazotropha sp.]
MPDGIYIRGSAQGYPLLFTADTGASKTIISKRVYNSMKTEDKPTLCSSSKLVSASGAEISEQGKGKFLLKLGPVQFEIEAVVAEIDDDGLLGVDILQNGNNGPADLLMTKGVLM